LISASLGGGIDLVATFARHRVMISSRFSVMNSYNMDLSWPDHRRSRLIALLSRSRRPGDIAISPA
jgi:hypothetical protein